MRKLIYVAAFVSMLVVACTKNKDAQCTYSEASVTKNEAESASVKAYLDSKGITGYVEDPTGLFYTIEAPGTGTITPEVCSLISVNYKGQFTDGSVFDQTTGSPATFYLGQVITGWQKGIPKIKSGGKITLYIPPSLGYGSKDVKDQSGNIFIPANSILIFNVELVSAK